jgi:ParB family chromosome partitioning protein
MNYENDVLNNEQIKVIEVKNIVASQNIRQLYDEKKMSELIESIKSVGLLNPLTVRKGNAEGVYLVLAGHRRLAACKRIGFDKIPCMVVDSRVENDLRIMIDENSIRHDVSVIEEADFITKQLRKLDIKQNEFANMIGKSESWVADRVAVTKYPTELITALKKGKVSFSVAREFAKIDNHKVMKEYLGYAMTSGCTPRMAREWVKCYNQDKDYVPVNKLFDDNIEKDRSLEEEILTGCHICNERFPLRSCVHVNVCPTCAKHIWEGGRP